MTRLLKLFCKWRRRKRMHQSGWQVTAVEAIYSGWYPTKAGMLGATNITKSSQMLATSCQLNQKTTTTQSLFCGEVRHVPKKCRLRLAWVICHNCGEKNHIPSLCRSERNQADVRLNILVKAVSSGSTNITLFLMFNLKSATMIA